MNCKNCGEPVDGYFCSNCGQSTKVAKLTLKTFLTEVSEGVFQVNRGFFYTLIHLFKSPGQSIQYFLDGKRKRHFKPIAYALILSTIYFLISRTTDQDTWIDNMIIGFSSYESEASIPPSLIWFSENFAYTNLLLLPVFSLASYTCFLGYGKNYLEHIVLNAFITGQQAIFYLAFNLLTLFIQSSLLEALPVFLALAYLAWVYWQFFKQGNRALNLIRSMLTYVLYLIFSTGILLIFWNLNW